LYGVALPQGFDSNKGDFAYCSYISIVVLLYSVFLVIIFADLSWFLTSGIRALSLAGVVGKYFFIFADFFFGAEKRGPRHYRSFQYISVKNFQKMVVYLISSQKNTQFKKKKRLKRRSEGQDIEVLKSAIF
jgi:hypothetical protein